MNEVRFGEVPERYIDASLAKAARAALDFCRRKYGCPDLKLRWLRKDSGDYAFGKILYNLKKLGGEDPEYVERGYHTESEEGLRGLTRKRVFAQGRPKSFFVVVDSTVTPESVALTTCHEFYHAAIAKLSISPAARDQEELQAGKFAERIIREMREAAHDEEQQEWGRRYRELNSWR